MLDQPRVVVLPNSANPPIRFHAVAGVVASFVDRAYIEYGRVFNSTQLCNWAIYLHEFYLRPRIELSGDWCLLMGDHFKDRDILNLADPDFADRVGAWINSSYCYGQIARRA